MSDRSAGCGGMVSPRITRIVSDDDVSDALEFLRDSAKDIGEAQRRSMETESLVKRTKAIVMKENAALSLGAQEREAILDARYAEAEGVAAEVFGVLHYLKARREHAAAVIEAWRSETATLRAMKL